MSKRNIIKLKSYSVETIPPDRRPGIWGTFSDGVLRPLCYLRKPKCMTDDDFNVVVSRLKIIGLNSDDIRLGGKFAITQKTNERKKGVISINNTN